MRGLAAACYLDPAAATAEREKIFDRSWQFVCHASDLPAAGTAMRFDCHGRSIVVLRGKDHALHGFINACRHRGSRLVDGDAHTGLAFCVDARLRCPYHGWTYDETGALAGVPDGQDSSESPDPGSTTLRPVCVEQWFGLVFFAYDAPALPLAQSLGDWPGLTDSSNTLGLRRLNEPRLHAMRADWKLACEHLLDHSHHATARPTLKPRIFAPSRFMPAGPSTAHTVTGLETAAAVPWWTARAYAQWLPAGASRTLAALFVWPNLLLQFMPDQLSVVQVLPGPTGACALREVAYGAPDASRELRLVRYLASRVRRYARAQDVRILERVQDGLASHGPDFTSPIAPDEPALRWFADRLRHAGIDAATPKPVRRTRLRTTRAVTVPDAVS